MNKKVPIIIIGLFAIVIVVLVVVFKDNLKGNYEKVSEYIILDNDSIWKYTGNWEKVSYDEVNNKSFVVYVDNLYKGKFTLKYGNEWNLFLNDKYQSYDGSLLAFSDNFAQVVSFTRYEVDDNDLNIINNILHSNYILENISSERVNIDLNSDNILDNLVVVSNLNDEEASNYFNLVYASIDGKISILIHENYDVKDYYNAPIYNINKIIKVNNKMNVIFNKGYFSDAGKSGNMMYQINDGNFELVIED